MRCACVAAILAALFVAPAATAQYEPTALPPLPGDRESRAFAIDSAGDVVGVSFRDAVTHNAVVWDRDGNPTALPMPPTPGPGTGSEASAINAAGVVVGFSGSSAVAWERDGNPTVLLPLPGNPGSSALGINSPGLIVGYDGTGTGLFEAVLWDRDGNPSALPPLLPSDSYTLALAINDAGEVVGISENKAVVWDRDGNPSPLLPLSGHGNSAANDINSSGEVAGMSSGGG